MMVVIDLLRDDRLMLWNWLSGDSRVRVRVSPGDMQWEFDALSGYPME